MPTTPTIVLVHGAWADASSWTGVIQRLQAAGHDGRRARRTRCAALPPTRPIIRNYLDTIDGPVVLVAHSYGGFVITNAATGAQNVKALVYVDAFIPDEGQPAVALTGAASALASAGTNPTSLFKLVPIPGAPPEVVDTYLLLSTVKESFAQDVSAEDAGADLRDPAAGLVRRARRAVRSAGLEGHPVLGDHREAGQDHRPRLAARDGRACRREDHRDRRLARLDGLPPGCRRRGHRTGVSAKSGSFSRPEGSSALDRRFARVPRRSHVADRLVQGRGEGVAVRTEAHVVAREDDRFGAERRRASAIPMSWIICPADCSPMPTTTRGVPGT